MLATPGFDELPRHAWAGAAERAELEERVGVLGARAARALALVNRAVRLPIADLLDPLQRPFRIGQEWGLYRDGPGRLHRLEVVVDGALRFRSVDPAHAWLGPQLRSRRLRPVVEATVLKAASRNGAGLSEWVAGRAREAFPGAQRVELRCLRGRFPGKDLEVTHTWVVEAPRWKARRE